MPRPVPSRWTTWAMPWGAGQGRGHLKFTLNSDTALANKGIHFKSEAEAFDASNGAVLPTNIMQTEDCVGHALRGQGKGKGKGQLRFSRNCDGMQVNRGIDFEAEAEAFDSSSGAGLPTIIRQTEQMQPQQAAGRHSRRAQRAEKGQQKLQKRQLQHQPQQLQNISALMRQLAEAKVAAAAAAAEVAAAAAEAAAAAAEAAEVDPWPDEAAVQP